MSFDAFVKIDGIEGESTDSNHSGWIEVLSFKAGVSQKVSATPSSAGGASAERTDIAPFAFAKLVDTASPKLFQACAAGTHFDTIIIGLYRAGSGEKVKFMEYKLSNCILSEVNTVGGGDFPAETISIDFGRIRITYVKQNRQGGGAVGNISAGWDLQKNCML